MFKVKERDSEGKLTSQEEEKVSPEYKSSELVVVESFNNSANPSI